MILKAHHGQAGMEFLGTYGWTFLIIVIAGAAFYSMGFFNPLSYMKTSCVGFDRLVYKDHVLVATREPGTWDLPIDDSDGNDRESRFDLHLLNTVTGVVRVTNIFVEYPDGTMVTWSERGTDCSFNNVEGDPTSGCLAHLVMESTNVMFSIEDVGNGATDLNVGSQYTSKVRVTYDVLGAVGEHSERAICSGKISGG
ncbi:MAG: hypothetical protein QF415_16200 [Candidatus Undinarchaeales archaeon]|jgi:hypothetical protein|nr:hypothetical protein [Candidatus Undinarchaeales archaeon]MDP7494260.1 hypothetical protein [Candidatus Undinarchaeales archaeon]